MLTGYIYFHKLYAEKSLQFMSAYAIYIWKSLMAKWLEQASQ